MTNNDLAHVLDSPSEDDDQDSVDDDASSLSSWNQIQIASSSSDATWNCIDDDARSTNIQAPTFCFNSSCLSKYG